MLTSLFSLFYVTGEFHKFLYKMVDIKVPSINTRTSLLKSAEATLLFFFLCIYMGGI